MRRNAERIAARRRIARKRREKPCKCIDRVHKSTLTGRRRRTAKPGMGVEDRQQRQRNARIVRRRDDAVRELGAVGVGLSVRIVVDIMKLGDARVSGFDHLHIRLRRDRLIGIGVDAIEKRVHRLAPRPETVSAGCLRIPAPGAARECPLECMRMEVRHAEQERSSRTLGVACRGARFDARNRAAAVDREHDVASPTAGQQRMLGEQPHAKSIATNSATASAVNGLTDSGAPDSGSSSTRNA
jgi:hypothetical protein